MAEPLDDAARSRAGSVLWSDGAADTERLYAILDAAQDATIYPRLRQAGADAEILPLYEGEAAAELAAVAPYVVAIPAVGDLFDWLWTDGWAAPWFILMRSGAAIDVLRAHFRRLVRVRTEDGGTLLFRFYDPRVLTRFLPTCDSGQLSEMFGPVVSYLTTDQAGRRLHRFSLDAGLLRHETHTLTGDPGT